MKPDLEGIERRLTEKHDDIKTVDTSEQRRQTSVADTSGIEMVVSPPMDIIRALDQRTGFACDQAYQIVWPKGEWKGMPLSLYCAEPRCRDEGGVCTGTRFVPHLDQWTTTEVDLRSRRHPSPQEIIAGVRTAAKRAALQTHRDEERSDREILDHVKLTWTRTIEAIRGPGGKWRRG